MPLKEKDNVLRGTEFNNPVVTGGKWGLEKPSGGKSPEPGAAEGRSLSRVGAARRGFQHPSWIAPEARAPHAAAHGAVGGVRPASAPLLEETRFVVSFLSLRESVVQRLTHRSVLQYRRPVQRRSCGLSLNSSGHARSHEHPVCWARAGRSRTSQQTGRAPRGA